MPGSGALILLAFSSLVVVLPRCCCGAAQLGFVVRSTIPDRPRRRMFIASVSFPYIRRGSVAGGTDAQSWSFNWVVVRGHTFIIWFGDSHPVAGWLRVAAEPGPQSFALSIFSLV